jgi:hypothetical protein
MLNPYEYLCDKKEIMRKSNRKKAFMGRVRKVSIKIGSV